MRNLAAIALASLGLLALASGTPLATQAAPDSQNQNRLGRQDRMAYKQAFNNKMVSGEQAYQNVTKLMTEIPWYTSLDYAKKKAAQEDKPIFWVHALGKLNGVT